MITRTAISDMTARAGFDRYLRDVYRGSHEDLIRDINATVNHLLHTDLEEAKLFLQKAGRCFSFLPKKDFPRYTAMQARYAHWIGQSKVALKKYNQAVDAFLSFRNYEAAAKTRQGLMDVLMYLGDYDEAIRTGKKALRYFRRTGNLSVAAKIMTNLGNIYHRLDKHSLALRYYDKARAVFEKTGGFPLALVDYNRANVYSNYNQLDVAAKLYQSAADTYRRIGMTLGVGKAEYSLAYLYYLDDKYAKALRAFDVVYDTFTSLGDRKSAAITKLDLAEIHIQLNQYSAALFLSEETLEAFQEYGLRYEQGKAYYFIAESYRRLGDVLRAREYLKQADNLFKREKNLLWQGVVQLAMCDILLADNKIIRAKNAAEKAKKLFSASGHTGRKIDAQIALIKTRLSNGSPHKAYRQAIALLKKPLMSKQKQELYSLLGMYHERFQRYDLALTYFQKAIHVVEDILANIYPDEVRFFFAADKYRIYLDAINCLIKLGRVRESFVQHSKALAILNQRRIPEDKLKDEIPSDMLNLRSHLRASLKKYNQLSSSVRHLSQAHAAMGKAEQKLWAQERKIRSYIFRNVDMKSHSVNQTEDYASFLRPHETLINYISSGNEVGLFCVSANQTKYISCEITPADLEALVRELHFLMEKEIYSTGSPMGGNDINRYLRKLYDSLIYPIRNAISEFDKVIFLVDGVFAQVPYHALPDEHDRPLGDLLETRVIVDPVSLERSSKQTEIYFQDKSAIFAPESSGLPMIENECVGIKKIFKRARLFKNGLANSRHLLEELSKSDGFVHIASHASRSSENPVFSKILMDDGPFFPFDLFASGIRARLVGLSGCQTAAPGIYYGNSFSLAKAFYQAGAQYVLASLWPVSDKISMVFMIEFYRTLRKEKDIHTAYWSAVKKIKAINPNPAFWSSFVLLGS